MSNSKNSRWYELQIISNWHPDTLNVYRKTIADEFTLVRSFSEVVEYIRRNNLPSLIIFDNDLGTDLNQNLVLDGYAAAKWLVYKPGIDVINLKFKVHPVAPVQIKSLLDNYTRHMNEAS